MINDYDILGYIASLLEEEPNQAQSLDLIVTSPDVSGCTQPQEKARHVKKSPTPLQSVFYTRNKSELAKLTEEDILKFINEATNRDEKRMRIYQILNSRESKLISYILEDIEEMCKDPSDIKFHEVCFQVLSSQNKHAIKSLFALNGVLDRFFKDINEYKIEKILSSRSLAIISALTKKEQFTSYLNPETDTHLRKRVQKIISSSCSDAINQLNRKHLDLLDEEYIISLASFRTIPNDMIRIIPIKIAQNTYTNLLSSKAASDLMKRKGFLLKMKTLEERINNPENPIPSTLANSIVPPAIPAGHDAPHPPQQSKRKRKPHIPTRETASTSESASKYRKIAPFPPLFHFFSMPSNPSVPGEASPTSTHYQSIAPPSFFSPPSNPNVQSKAVHPSISINEGPDL